MLLKLEELQDLRLREVEKTPTANPDMTPQERDEALAMLRDPALLDRVARDFQVVGERTNKLVSYLAAVSRKLDQPLAVLIQSTSAAGKTTLMEAVLNLCPPEDVVKYSAMTGQSLYYIAGDGLKHKILAIVEEEGAAKASYALKLLQSEGELRIASTGKEGNTGRLTTQEYRVQGPTMLFLTTTGITTDEELLNRCLVLTVQEDRDQTRAIHDLQRRRQTLDGLLAANDHQAVLTLDAFVTQQCRVQAVDRADFRFSRKEVREATGWGDTQLKIHLKRLVELEFVGVHRDRSTNRHAYELLFACDAGDRVLPELLNVAELTGFDASRSGLERNQSAVNRADVKAMLGQGRVGKAASSPEESRPKPRSRGKTLKIVPPPSKNGTASDEV
ncbi:MAG: hypothetical protein K8U57_33730 [Planctomycetes bacterium]|nr:hypothetical protein [Planctomycetota bacterium]